MEMHSPYTDYQINASDYNQNITITNLQGVTVNSTETNRTLAIYNPDIGEGRINSTVGNVDVVIDVKKNGKIVTLQYNFPYFMSKKYGPVGFGFVSFLMLLPLIALKRRKKRKNGQKEIPK
ncbi:MAG: hypothetical protein ACXACR_17615 [Candidatus Hodarchaeales archaeon]